MNRIVIAAAALAALSFAPLALAQPAPGVGPPGPAPQVTVTIGPAFADKAQRILIGPRDLDQLQRELTADVTRAAAKRPGQAPVRMDLVLQDAVPNRPTFDQLGQQTGLSYLGSIGLGGATIGGSVTLPDGSVRPVSFQWYETDLRNEFGPSTWTDAERAFDLFAGRTARGDLTAYRLGSTSRTSGDFAHRLGGF